MPLAWIGAGARISRMNGAFAFFGWYLDSPG